VSALAERRAAARAARDFAESDRLRDEIAAQGWTVRDTPEGWTLAERPAYDVLPTVRDLPDRSGQPATRRCTVALLAEGWPDDLRTCVEALLAHAPADVVVVLFDNGDVDGTGAAVHALAAAHPGRVEELHVERPAGWGEARQALLRHDVAAVHVLMDPSTVLEGDALSPLLAALADDTVAGAGWRGVDVVDGWTEFADAGPGEVEALLGYLFAVRRTAALQVPLPAKARFYRNADIEWSYLLREAGAGRLVALALPVRQGRHRGYHDSDPAYRDKESRRTYDRFLQRFRGREDLRLRR
jgi:glycosyltransferase involved in cell wall biosynthesis